MPGRGYVPSVSPGLIFLTVTAECPVIDIKIVCGAADRFMLQLDLANRSEHHILGYFPPLRFYLKCSYHHERSSETIKVQN